MKRRNFIKVGAAFTITSFFFIIYTRKTLTTKILIEKIIKRELSYLKISEKEISKFSKDVITQNIWKFSEKQKLVLSIGILSNEQIMQREFLELKDQIITKFLLSTDFFINKMNENIEVKYLGNVHGPYTTPCNNPFSSTFYKV